MQPSLVSPDIYVNGRFLSQQVSGVQRFAREIISAASETEAWTRKAAVLVPRKPVSPATFANLPVWRRGFSNGHLWEQSALSWIPKDSLLINLCNTAPLARHRQIVVLHDAAVAAQPHNFRPAFRWWYQRLIRSYSRRAIKLGTVSRFSASEIAKHFGIAVENLEIVGESGEHILRKMPDYSLHTKYGLDEDGYFLAASSWAPSKNFEGVLRAVARLPGLLHKFVIVGSRNSRIFSSLNFGIGSAVEVGYASDAQLRALYERASCFVYPSIYEGFGLPPLEAMCCGCPVLVSNVAAMPEVCASAAAYCDPNDAHDIARQLVRLLNSRNARLELRSAGLARAKEWTWNKAARDLTELIKKAS
jgi:glycosyltransferase involved in cell wall biosynthesis